MKKTYTISTITLATALTGCADNIVGDWDGVTITSIDDSSFSYALPANICTDYSGTESCSSFDFGMSIQEDLTGSMEMDVLSYNFEPTIVVEKGEGSNYKIVASIEEEEDTYDLDCSLVDAQNLQCTDSQDLNVIIDFKKE